MSAATTREQRQRQLGIDCADRVVWKDWQPGGAYTRKLTIKNVDARAQTIAFTLPERTTTFLTPFPLPVTLSSGLAYELELRFCPSELVEVHDLMEVHVKGRGSFVVYLDGLVPFAQLSVPAAHNFDYCAVASTASHTLTVRNTGTVPVEFAWEVPPPFAVQPAQGTLPQAASMTLTVLFAPRQACAVVAEAVCHMSGIERPLASLRLSGVGKLPFVLLRPGVEKGNEDALGTRALLAAATTAAVTTTHAQYRSSKKKKDGANNDEDDGDGNGADAGKPTATATTTTRQQQQQQHALQLLSPREALLDFGDVLAGSVVTRTFYLVNPTPVTAVVTLQQQQQLHNNNNNDGGDGDDNNNGNNGDGDGDDGSGACMFAVTPSSCTVARGARTRVRVTYTARGVGALHSGTLVVRVRAGNEVRVRLQGHTVGLAVALSTSYVNYGEVDLARLPAAKQRTRYVQLSNHSPCATRFQLLCTAPGAAFVVEPCAGELPSKGSVRLCIVFQPTAPIHYLRRLLLLVRDAATALYVDVFGSAYDGDTRPMPFGLREVEWFHTRQARGQGLLSPAQLAAHAAHAQRTAAAAAAAALTSSSSTHATSAVATTTAAAAVHDDSSSRGTQTAWPPGVAAAAMSLPTTMRARRARAGCVSLAAVATLFMGGSSNNSDSSSAEMYTTGSSSSGSGGDDDKRGHLVFARDVHSSGTAAGGAMTTRTMSAAAMALSRTQLPFYLDATVLSFDAHRAGAVRSVSVCNTTSSMAVAVWCVPSCCAYSVTPLQQEVPPGGACVFTVTMLPRADTTAATTASSSSSSAACVCYLECYVNYVEMRSYRLTSPGSLTPPHCLTLQCRPQRTGAVHAMATTTTSVLRPSRALAAAISSNNNNNSSSHPVVVTADALVCFRTCRVGGVALQLLTLTNTSDMAAVYDVRDVTLRMVNATLCHDVAAVALPPPHTSTHARNTDDGDGHLASDDNNDGEDDDEGDVQLPAALAATARYTASPHDVVRGSVPTPLPRAAATAYTSSNNSNNNNVSSSGVVSDADGVFAVYPASGVLAARQQTLLLLRFAPRTHARYAATLTLAAASANATAAATTTTPLTPSTSHTTTATTLSSVYAGEARATATSQLTVQLHGEGCTPRLDVVDAAAATVTFAPTCVTGTTRRVLRLRNPTPLTLHYTLTPCAALSTVLQFASGRSGVVRAGGVARVCVGFRPREARAYEGYVSVQLREADEEADGGGNNDDDTAVAARRAAQCEYVMTLTVRGRGAHGLVEVSPTVCDLGRVAGLQPRATTLTLYNSGICAVGYEVRVLVCASPTAWQQQQRTPQLRNHRGVLPARTHATVLVTVYPAAGRSEYILYVVLSGGSRGGDEEGDDGHEDDTHDATATAIVAHDSALTAAAVRQRYPHCTLLVHGSRPAVQIVDVCDATRPATTAAPPRSRLWQQLSVDAINARLAAAVLPRDVETRSYTFAQYVGDVVPVGVDVGVAHVHTHALRTTLWLRNVGDCTATFQFLLPTEHDVSDEAWYAEDAALRAVQEVLDRRLLELAPRRGSLAAGACACVTLTYRPLVVGVHTLPVLLRVGDGKRVLLALEGRTLPRDVVGLAWRHAPVYTLAPVALGDMTPPLQSIAFDNPCAHDVRYAVDVAALAALTRRHGGFAVLQCVTPRGVVRARDRGRLCFYFRPLEATRYVLRVPVHTDGGESYALTLVGCGYDATRTPLSTVRAAHVRALQPLLPCNSCGSGSGGNGGDDEDVDVHDKDAVHEHTTSPATTRTTTTSPLASTGAHASSISNSNSSGCGNAGVTLSPRVLRLGAVPFFALQRRLVQLRNTHPTHTFAFAWQATPSPSPSRGGRRRRPCRAPQQQQQRHRRDDGNGDSNNNTDAYDDDEDEDEDDEDGEEACAGARCGDHGVYVQPACGVLAPGAACTCRVVVYSGSACQLLNVSIMCHVRDETALDAAVQRACEDVTAPLPPSSSSSPLLPLPGRLRAAAQQRMGNTPLDRGSVCSSNSSGVSGISDVSTATRAPPPPQRRARGPAAHVTDAHTRSAADNYNKSSNNNNDDDGLVDSLCGDDDGDNEDDDAVSRAMRTRAAAAAATGHNSSSVIVSKSCDKGKDVRRDVCAAARRPRERVSVTVPPVRSLGERALQSRVTAARRALQLRHAAASDARVVDTHAGGNCCSCGNMDNGNDDGDAMRGCAANAHSSRGGVDCDDVIDDDDGDEVTGLWQAHELLLQAYVLPVDEYERVYGARALSHAYAPALVDAVAQQRTCASAAEAQPQRPSRGELHLLNDILDELLRSAVATPQVRAAFTQPFVRRRVRYSDLVHDEDAVVDSGHDARASAAVRSAAQASPPRADDEHRPVAPHAHHNNSSSGRASAVVPSAIEEALEQLVFAAVASLAAS